jgi:hypothetical protein
LRRASWNGSQAYAETKFQDVLLAFAVAIARLVPEGFRHMVRWTAEPEVNMLVSEIQSLAISARMAAIVDSETFDRLFAGVEFNEVDGDILFVYARSEDCAAEMEDKFALHVSIIVSGILGRDIGVVMVLPRYRAEHQQFS